MVNPPVLGFKPVTLPLSTTEQRPKAHAPATFAAPKDGLPVRGGRSSLPENTQGTININSKKYEHLQPGYAIEWLPVLEYFAVFHQDVAYALDNIVMLANSGHQIFFAEKVKESEKKKMLEYITTNAKKWYANSGGMNSLVNDLLAQCAITGAVSGEIIPNKSLNGLHKVERVSPHTIRLFRDPETDQIVPFQRVEGYNPGASTAGYKELNPLTYKYIALRRVQSGPYATPPFMAALEGIFTQKDMLANFKVIMKKLGALGTLAAYLTPPEQEDNEDPAAYLTRCRVYLEQAMPELLAFQATGVVAGFEGTHKFEMISASGSAAGADIMFTFVDRLLMAGLKQDPNMLGRQQSTTETFGRVLLAKLTTQITNYQETVATFIADVYWLALVLAGFDPGGEIEIIFNPSLYGDKLKEEDAFGKKVANLTLLKKEGIISQQQMAEEAGYDKPFLPEAPAPAPVPGAPKAPGAEEGGSENPTTETDPTDAKTTDNNAASVRAAARFAKADRLFYSGTRAMRTEMLAEMMVTISPYRVEAFDYSVPEGCRPPSLIHSFDTFDSFTDAVMNGFVRKYGKAVQKRFKNAVASLSANIRTAVGKLPGDAPLSDITQTVFYEMYSRWPSLFTARLEGVVSKMVNDVYRQYRNDKKVLGDMKRKPAPLYALHDYRAMEYMKDIDQLYLGKFITDPDTRQRLTRWIEQRYAVEDNPIGKNAASVALFAKELQETILMEEWKIRRIVDTSVNKMRNYAHVSYLNQAKVESFTVVEVMDRLTCPYCQHADGKSFNVTKAYEKVKKVVDAGTGEVKEYSPFATSFSVEDFEKMSAEELQSAGIDAPPFHCHCRGRIVAE